MSSSGNGRSGGSGGSGGNGRSGGSNSNSTSKSSNSNSSNSKGLSKKERRALKAIGKVEVLPDGSNPPVPSAWEWCGFYLRGKGRFCSHPRVGSTGMCTHHAAGTDEGGDVRVACPIDPSHTVLKSRLAKHVRVCPRKTREETRPRHPAAAATDINIPSVPLSEQKAEGGLAAAAPAQLAAFWDALENAYGAGWASGAAAVEVDPRVHAAFESELATPGRNIKHVAQVASLVEHLASRGLLSTELVYVEPGAGKGCLCEGVGEALGVFANRRVPGYKDMDPWDGPPLFVLIEQQALRMPMERGSRRAAALRMEENIKDVDLEAVPELADRPMVMLAKHLCGGATDLAMYMTTRTDTLASATKAVLVATCCYGKITPDVFVGLPYLASSGLDAYFDWLRVTAAWAMSHRSVPAPPIESQDLAAWSWRSAVADPGSVSLADLDRPAKEIMGIKACALLDMARMAYLRAAGFDNVERMVYVNAHLTPQNGAILAWRS